MAQGRWRTCHQAESISSGVFISSEPPLERPHRCRSNSTLMLHGYGRRRRLWVRRLNGDQHQLGLPPATILQDVEHICLHCPTSTSSGDLDQLNSGISMDSQYLSGGLDQGCRAQTGAAGRGGLFHPLQQDPGSGNVAPRHPEARLHLPADAPGHVVGHLKRERAEMTLLHIKFRLRLSSILTKAAMLKSFAIVFRTPPTWVIKDMPAGGEALIFPNIRDNFV